ncbi:helix-turn-helix transcriptional regulator [Streptomyces flavofungini]|uniref:PAS domain-containing protein n=1 Tax=Streptomyces flavofungini TaxID=68200 RepID=A0ABS0XBZ2_9ACTN|nr:PAS domain-containing protein [Streptomyces flavofungini]MBJ3810727.1 PAS domain-containing protein [Streptomyces flavofungini]GHC51740.1 DNA-binding protein [Streptomyces flavofungini]
MSAADSPTAADAALDGDRNAERDAILAALVPVADGIAATFGSLCEVVVHDYRRPEESVVSIAGSVTGRSVGGAMSEIGMGMLARGDDAGDELNYLTRTQDGKLVKSSTMLLRDSGDAVFGALCVNLDITAVQQVGALIGELAGVATPAEVPTTTFGDSAEVVDAVVRSVVDAYQLRRSRPWGELDRAERVELFRGLDERGVFAVRRAVPQVAARLGISRASAYNYLAKARAQEPPTAGPDTAQGASA